MIPVVVHRDPGPALLDQALSLRTRVFVVEQGVPPEIERDGQDAQARHVALVSGQSVVATGRLRVMGTHAKLERVAVEQSARGHGLGRAVVAELESLALADGASVATLASQEGAIPFYEALGYASHGTAFLEAGILHRWMKKTLRG